MIRTDSSSKVYRTLALLCEEESLSDAQLKAYQTRLQEYRTYLEAVSRLANCGNVCITEEAVMIGDNGLLTGESLNALQHAGAISVYNTLQQNNWEYPVPEEGDVAMLKTHTTVPDDFLDSEKPIRSDWPSVFISECFVEGEKAKLHGSARPLRSFLPPSIVFRNASDIDDEIVEPELPTSNVLGIEAGLEIISTQQGLAVRKTKENESDIETIPIEDYYFGRQEGTSDYVEEKAEFRFKCAVCQRMFYSNIKLMHHIMGHVDEGIQALLGYALNQCRVCNRAFSNAFCLRSHMEKDHEGSTIVETAKVGENGDATTTKIAAIGFSCRICAKEVASDLALAHHLQSTHRQREMPYVCRICLFRSSLYDDILDHFKKAHNGSNHLLCTYCLRIFTPSDARVPGVPLVSPGGSGGGGSGAVSTAGLGAGVGQTQVYLQHLRMHQVQHQLRRCPTCRLNFTNKSDYQVHRKLDHKACTSNATSAAAAEQQLKQQQQQQHQKNNDHDEMEGEHEQLPVQEIGEFMTDSADVDQAEEEEESVSNFEHQEIKPVGVNTMRTNDHTNAQDCVTAATTREDVIVLNAPEPSRTKNLSDTKLPPEAKEHVCLECGDSLATDNHKQYLPCSACVFATCCAVAFSRHVHRAHIYTPGSAMADTHSGSPLIRPVKFDWLLSAVPTAEKAPELPTAAPAASTEESEPMDVDKLEVQPVDEEKEELEPKVSDPNIVVDCVNGSERLFACPMCALTGVDGNTLAKHLVKDCGSDVATLKPDPEIVEARKQAEEQMRLQEEQEATFDVAGSAAAVEHDAAGAEEMAYHPGQTAGAVPQQAVAVATGGTDTLPATIDITDASGEVVQRLVLPEDLHLEPGQTLFLIEGEDGQPQLAVMSQADWEQGQQMVMQTDDDTSNLLLYGNTEGEVPVMEEEKENQV